MDKHEFDHPVVVMMMITAMIGVDLESLVCVEAGSELTDVCFGGCVERDPWHRGFVAGRTHERDEHWTLTSGRAERR